VLIGWTLFLWLSRLRNVVNNDELTSSGRAIRIGVVVIFVVFAGLTAVAVRQMRAAQGRPGRGNSAWQSKTIGLFIAWTAGYWLIRGVGILIDGDYSIGFKTVHTVLMAVSLTLAFLTARSVQP
jgi:hypothetical protein